MNVGRSFEGLDLEIELFRSFTDVSAFGGFPQNRELIGESLEGVGSRPETISHLE